MPNGQLTAKKTIAQIRNDFDVSELKRTLNAGKRIKRVAIVALARKLVVALWRYLTTGLVPEGAVLKTAKA